MKFKIFFTAVISLFSWFATGCQQQPQTLPQCNLKKINMYKAVVRGEGKTFGSALESVSAKLKLKNEFNYALSLWRDQDRILPLQKNGKKVSREVVFSDILEQYFLLNKGCQIKYACQKKGMVRTGVKCSQKISFEEKLKKLFAIIDNKVGISLWAKIKVVTGNLGGKTTKKEQILAQAIENVIY
ncbi:MAG: hypothetical protein PF689_12255, partial [Deltaproteobacteria bacterium]|nr:hypothetical protein [Deltaproteobacteria bacterium]